MIPIYTVVLGNAELPPDGALRRIRDLLAELPTPEDNHERVRVEGARWLFAFFTRAPVWDPVQAAFWAGFALSEGGRTIGGLCGRPLPSGATVCDKCSERPAALLRQAAGGNVRPPSEW